VLDCPRRLCEARHLWSRQHPFQQLRPHRCVAERPGILV
jgi:hypothetical protein